MIDLRHRHDMARYGQQQGSSQISVPSEGFHQCNSPSESSSIINISPVIVKKWIFLIAGNSG
jgi:hypothetical protein